MDGRGESLAKKVRKAQMEHFNYVGVIGKEEVREGRVSLRKRGES